MPEPNKKLIPKATYVAEITPAVERSRNQWGVVWLSPEVAQNLKDKPVTPLSGDIRDLPEATATRIARDFDCVGLDYNAFYPGGLRLRSATVVDCDGCWIKGRSLSGVEGHAVYVWREGAGCGDEP